MTSRPTIPDTPSSPKVVDTNGNGVLDAADILAALYRERRADGVGDEKKPLHAMIRSILQPSPEDPNIPEIIFAPKQGKACDSNKIANVAVILENGLKEILEKLGQNGETTSRNALEASALRGAREEKLSPATTEMLRSLSLAEFDFATTFRDAFPKGKISIAPADVPEILQLFWTPPATPNEKSKDIPELCHVPKPNDTRGR